MPLSRSARTGAARSRSARTLVLAGLLAGYSLTAGCQPSAQSGASNDSSQTAGGSAAGGGDERASRDLIRMIEGDPEWSAGLVTSVRVDENWLAASVDSPADFQLDDRITVLAPDQTNIAFGRVQHVAPDAIHVQYEPDANAPRPPQWGDVAVRVPQADRAPAGGGTDPGEGPMGRDMGMPGRGAGTGAGAGGRGAGGAGANEAAPRGGDAGAPAGAGAGGAGRGAAGAGGGAGADPDESDVELNDTDLPPLRGGGEGRRPPGIGESAPDAGDEGSEMIEEDDTVLDPDEIGGAAEEDAGEEGEEELPELEDDNK